MLDLRKPTIRTLVDRPDHLDAVARWVWSEWRDHSGLSQEQTRTRLDNPAGCPATLVAEEDGAPVGVLGFQRYVKAPGEAPSLFVDVLFVPETHRGRGIGAALAREGIDRAREFATELFVYTAQRDWYQRRGWSVLTVDPLSSMFVLVRPT